MRQKDILLMKDKMEKFTKKDTKDVTKEDVDAFVKDLIAKTTYTTSKTYIPIINNVLKEAGNTIKITFADYEKNNDYRGIYSKKEIESMLKNIINYQDKFILLAVYNGIIDNSFSELTTLKTKDVDIEKGIIKTSERVVIMDDLFKEITKKAIMQDSYEMVDSNGVSKFYDMNTSSDYLLKTKPQKRNGYGLEPMSREGFKSRFKNIMKSCECDGTITSIEKSGYINKMKEIKDDWNVIEVRDWLKENNIKLEGYNLLRIFKKFYKNS